MERRKSKYIFNRCDFNYLHDVQCSVAQMFSHSQQRAEGGWLPAYAKEMVGRRPCAKRVPPYRLQRSTVGKTDLSSMLHVDSKT